MPMTSALTPRTGVSYLSELTADVRAVLVLSAEGRILAASGDVGPGLVAQAAQDLLTAVRPAAGARIEVNAAKVFVRLAPAHAVVVVTGTLALDGLMWHDLGCLLQALAGAPGPSEASAPRFPERALDGGFIADAAIEAAGRRLLAALVLPASAAVPPA